MITDLEKQFFETFEIEPKYKDYRTKNGKEYECKNPNNRNIRLCYPKITDRHYLELICVLGYFETIHECKNYEELKKYILDYYLNLDSSEIRELKHQVQELFKGE